jgi:peroxiredoxin
MMKTKTILSLILTGTLAFATACDKQEAQADQAEAVETEQAEANEGEEAEQGAAAKADEANEAEKAEEQTTAVVDKPAPDFKLKDEAGNAHKLSDYKGKIVVLEWTNPDCPYVERHKGEEKTMTETHKALGEDVVWLAVDSTKSVTPESAKKAKDEWGFAQPVLLDPAGETGKMYGAKTTPHMYVIDKEGVLRYQGAIDDDARDKKAKEERVNYVSQAVQAVQKGEDVAKKETKPYGCSVKYGS